MIYNCQDINSRLYNKLAELTNLLDLGFYEKGGNVFIYTKDQKNISLLERIDDYIYKFTIEKDGEKITGKFNHNRIAITKDNNTISITPASINYVNRKEDESLELDINTLGLLSFSKKTNDEENTILVTQDNNHKYIKMEKTIKTKDSTGITSEKILISENQYAVAKHLIHRYDESGRMVRGAIYNDDLYIQTNDYIQDELNNNPVVIESIIEMENNFPGIIKSNDKLFSLLNEIQNNRIKKEI